MRVDLYQEIMQSQDLPARVRLLIFQHRLQVDDLYKHAHKSNDHS